MPQAPDDWRSLCELLPVADGDDDWYVVYRAGEEGQMVLYDLSGRGRWVPNDGMLRFALPYWTTRERAERALREALKPPAAK